MHLRRGSLGVLQESSLAMAAFFYFSNQSASSVARNTRGGTRGANQEQHVFVCVHLHDVSLGELFQIEIS